MIISGLDTQQAAAQLEHLFGIEPIFRRRGRRVTAHEETANLLFPVRADGFNQDVFSAMQSQSFRRIVATVANSERALTISELQPNHSDLTSEQIAAYLESAVTLGLLGKSGNLYARTPGKNFGASLEWYVAAVCIAELASMAFWGVTVLGIVGDYDVIVIREAQIGYIECKSGRAGNITDDDLRNFLERELRLAPQFAIFLLDGASLGRANSLAERAVKLQQFALFESPLQSANIVMLVAAKYRRFVRLEPLNIFFVAAQPSLAESLREVYEFLTLVCDRHLSLENVAAKERFR